MTQKLGTVIISAPTIVTMDRSQPRAEAVAVKDGIITAVGTLEECKAALPAAEVKSISGQALLPGFIDSHSHLVLSGPATMAPAYYIAPWVAPKWTDVVDIFKQAIADSAAGSTLSFFGFDGLLHGITDPTASVLDEIFGNRKVLVMGNSGHTAYVTTAVLEELGWVENPPQNPVGGYYGRNEDGSLNGIGTELPAVIQISAPVRNDLPGKPLQGAIEYYALLSRAGITSTSEMTYMSELQTAYETIAAMPSCPLRVSFYHLSNEADCGEPLVSDTDPLMIRKQGIKLFADGSPWVGNIAMSTPYLENDVTRSGGVLSEKSGSALMNYSRDELDHILDAHAAQGWQMAFHVNGDIALDVVLDAYEYALRRYNLVGTDHRWRVEHIGGARKDQFERMKSLGVVPSMGPFQFYYWGDLLDGTMFDTSVGAQWQRFRDAFNAGLPVSFHNDGSVSPPTPLLNIQTAVTRRTSSGTLRGPEQAVSLQEALEAETINGAFALGIDDKFGSIEVGKVADFVELSQDPFEVEMRNFASVVAVGGTWLSGSRIDIDEFAAAFGLINHDEFEKLSSLGSGHTC